MMCNIFNAFRYGLHNRKCKLDTSVQRRPSFPITKLVAFQLLSSKDNQNWDNTSIDKNSLTECSMDWRLSMNRRVLTFLRQSHIPQGEELLIFVSYV